MRIAAVILAGALGLALSTPSANAAPFVPGPAGAESNIVEVAGGCGRGFHPNRWGRCVPSRYSQARPRTYYRYAQPRTSWYGYPRRWHSPTDHVARQLNRQELGRIYSGGGVYYGGPGMGY